jgi:hypothetical protein
MFKEAVKKIINCGLELIEGERENRLFDLIIILKGRV